MGEVKGKVAEKTGEKKTLCICSFGSAVLWSHWFVFLLGFLGQGVTQSHCH